MFCFLQTSSTEEMPFTVSLIVLKLLRLATVSVSESAFFFSVRWLEVLKLKMKADFLQKQREGMAQPLEA